MTLEVSLLNSTKDDIYIFADECGLSECIILEPEDYLHITKLACSCLADLTECTLYFSNGTNNFDGPYLLEDKSIYVGDTFES